MSVEVIDDEKHDAVQVNCPTMGTVNTALCAPLQSGGRLFDLLCDMVGGFACWRV